MASGLNHIRASSYAAAPMGIITGLTLGIPIGTGVILGCLLGIPLTPDLDQIGVNKSEWILVKKFGPFGFAWLMLWWLYAWIIPHRSFWSHFPIVGTVLRLVYMISLPAMLYIYKGYNIVLPELVWEGLIGIFIGLLMSDFLHWVMDL